MIDSGAARSYFASMQTVGIKVLKNDLSRYIRAAEAGEIVRVTDRGRVVAEISRPRAPEGQTEAERQWAMMIAEGIVKEAKRPFTGPPPRGTTRIPFDELMRDLDESRSDR